MAAALGRLLKRGEFLAVAAANRRWTTPGLVLQARSLPATDDRQPPLRVGFTATKKVGNAVVRNRARRRLRAAVREVLGVQPGAVPADLVLIARHSTPKRPFGELKSDLSLALARLGIVKS